MPESFFQKKTNLYLILFIIPVLLYLNTVTNEYALDDSIVITQNSYVKQGFKGIGKIFSTETFTGFFKKKKDLVQGGRYRPLSVASFAFEHALYGEKPGLSHIINALLYGLLCMVLFELLRHLILYLDPKARNVSVAFLAVLLFAIHPIHTEVVANIKGRDELLAGLFFLLSFLCLLKSFTNSSIYLSLATGVCFFLALLSKENAIALIPVAILLIVFRTKAWNIKALRLGFLFLIVGASSYLLIRYRVIGSFSGSVSQELMNNPFFEAHNGEKIPTILYTLLLYLKLLVFPYPLTYDYYPYHIALQTWTAPWVIISALLHLLLIIAGFYFFRKKSIISFAILFYFILLLPVSNLFVNIGSFMNERFIFLPSIGFALIAGNLLDDIIFRKKEEAVPRKVGIALLTLILLFFSFITVNRNTIWKNNLTLFTHDVKISSGSAKGNCAAGGILYETALKTDSQRNRKEMLKESVDYLDKAISIYPNYVDALLLSGNAHFELNRNIPKVLACYSKIFSLAPGYELAYQNLNKMLAATNDPSQRKTGYRIILQYKPNDFDANYQIGVTYGKMLNQLDSAIFFLSNAARLQDGNKLVNRDLGVAFAMNGEYLKSLPFFEKLVQLYPDDADNYINLGITYQNLGKTIEARAMYAKAEALKSRGKK